MHYECYWIIAINCQRRQELFNLIIQCDINPFIMPPVSKPIYHLYLHLTLLLTTTEVQLLQTHPSISRTPLVDQSTKKKKTAR